ncbi:MAG: carboxypeptidase regulatory-like domain-containing protein, partial [Gammaproteobacteria bacterium]
PGEVVLGCNIHDWMKAYVFVSDAPYFTVTDAAGAARLDLPPGDYRVRVWHPELGGDSEATVVPQKVVAGGESELNFSIEEKHAWKPRRAPSFAGPDYR